MLAWRRPAWTSGCIPIRDACLYGLGGRSDLLFLASDDEERVDVRDARSSALVQVLRPTRATPRGGLVAAGLHKVAVCGWRVGQVQLWE